MLRLAATMVTDMRRFALLVMSAVALVSGCGHSQRSPDDSEGAAVAACRTALSDVATDRLATTVRDEGPSGYVVNAWTEGTASGVPDYVCEVARDENADRGVAVVDVRPSPAG